MDNLRLLRTEKGLKQKDIAEFLGVNRTTYVKYETGASEPDNATLIRLSDFFNVSIDFLLGKTDLRNYNDYNPGINEKDEKDIARNLEKIMADLEDGEAGPLCYGGEISDDTKELLRGAIEQALRIAKIENKAKYTPNQYRK